MSVKIIIANNNDILYNSLSNITLQYDSKIEIVYVPNDQLSSLIGQIKPKENVIILDSIISVSFYINILKNIMNRMDKANVIILVIDSQTAPNIINQEKTHLFFRKEQSNFSVLDAINIIVNTIKDTLDIEKTIDTILWKLGFTSYFKGTIYLKDAILLAYNDTKLFQDMNILVKKVAEKNNIVNEKVVRSAMDKSLNTMLDYTDINVFYDIFGDDYDGRKISVKYFIDLCMHYLEKQRYCCLDAKNT